MDKIKFAINADIRVPGVLPSIEAVQYWGGHAAVETVAREMGERFGQSRLATVEWWYQAEHGADYRNITMQPPPPVYDSYYPWLGEPVESYFAQFLKASASVLFIM